MSEARAGALFPMPDGDRSTGVWPAQMLRGRTGMRAPLDEHCVILGITHMDPGLLFEQAA